MNIIAQYDSSVSNAPAGFKTAVQSAINFIDHLITNPITVTLTFSYGEILGTKMENDALGESSTNGNVETYGQLVSQLAAAATSTSDKESLAALPAVDPTNGGAFWLSDAQAKLFGLGSSAGFTDPQDGFVALSNTYAFTYNPNDRQVPGEFDAIGVLEHEITEAIGRISYLGLAGTGSFSGKSIYAPLDLFRYSGAGQHTVAQSAGSFSVDGQHMLMPFNNPSNGGDGGDWSANVLGDSFGDGFSGVAGLMSPADVQVMDVLGYVIGYPRPLDFHNDGLANLLVESKGGSVAIGEVVAGGKVDFEQLGGLGPEWKFVGVGDFLGDGVSDFLVENAGGALVAGEVGADVTAAFTQIATLGREWKIVGAGDLLGDGKADVIMENAAGAVDLGQVQFAGQASFTRVGALGPEWSFKGTGDFLGEGHDQFLIETSAGAVYVGDVRNGEAQYAKIGGLGPEWKFVEAGDFLGDGKSGFLIENANGAVDVGEVGAGGQAAYTQIAALGSGWKFVGAGDYLGQNHDQFLIENASGEVVVGDYAGGQIHYTAVAGLGPEWAFHA